MSDEQYVFSQSEEWFNSDFYPTREAAIADAPDELGLADGDTFYVGVAMPPRKPLSDAMDIAESLVNEHMNRVADALVDECHPDSVDGYPDIPVGTRKRAIQQIADILNNITPDPTFYKVEKVSEHRAEAHPIGG